MAEIDWNKGNITQPDDQEPDWNAGKITEPSGTLRRAGDLALGFTSGALGATKGISDAFGADNRASRGIGRAQKAVDATLSPEARMAQSRQMEILDAASDKGFVGQVAAGGRAFMEAPVQTMAMGLGSVAPFVAASLIPGGQAATAARLGMGVGMGAGIVKGSIFEDQVKRGMEAGMTEEQARAAATQAQSYAGPNKDQIALGGALGVADAAFGLTPAVTKAVRQALGKEAAQTVTKQAVPSVGRAALRGAAAEMPVEFAQGTQEQVAANIAAQRAGYEAGTFEGAFSQGALEALASGGPGAAFGVYNRPRAAQEDPPPPTDPSQPAAEGAPGQPPAADRGFNPQALQAEQNARLGALADEEAGAPAVPQTAPPDGAAARAAQQQAAEEQRRAAIESARGEASPDDEIFQSTGADVRPLTPSQSMGLNPAAGPLSAAAALAVDTGAAPRTVDLANATPEERAAYDAATFDPAKTRQGVQDRKRARIEELMERAAMQSDTAPTQDSEDANVPFGNAVPDAAARSEADTGRAEGVADAGGAQANAQGVSGTGAADTAGQSQQSVPLAKATTGQKVKSLKEFMARKRAEREAANVQNATQSADVTVPEENVTPQAASSEAPTPEGSDGAAATGVPAAGAAPGVEAAGVGRVATTTKEPANGTQTGKTITEEAKREAKGSADTAVAAHSAGGKAVGLQKSDDRSAADAKFFADLTSRESFVQEWRNGLNPDAEGAVQRHMLRIAQDPKVLDAVVQLVPVDVMDMLKRAKLTPKMVLNDPAMLKGGRIGVDGNDSVSVPVDAASSIMRAVASVTAKDFAKNQAANAGRLPVDGGAADNTRIPGAVDVVGGEPGHSGRAVSSGAGTAAENVRSPQNLRTVSGNAGSALTAWDGDFQNGNSLTNANGIVSEAQQAEAQGPQTPDATAGVADAGADEQGAQWNRMTTIEREAVATRAGLNKVAVKNLAKRGWQGLDRAQQQNLRKGFERPAAQTQGGSPTDFIPAPDGGLDYGEITPAMAKEMRRQAGKIRLTRGIQNADGTGYGLVHIEARHGNEIRSSGFDSVEQFLVDAFQHMDEIWKPGATSQLIAVQSGRTGKVVFIQLEAEKQGGFDYYRVNSAFPADEKYVARKEKKEGWKPLWSRDPVPADASGASGFVDQSPKAGETTPTVSGQGGKASVPQTTQQAQTDEKALRDRIRSLRSQIEQVPETLDASEDFTVGKLETDTLGMEGGGWYVLDKQGEKASGQYRTKAEAERSRASRAKPNPERDALTAELEAAIDDLAASKADKDAAQAAKQEKRQKSEMDLMRKILAAKSGDPLEIGGMVVTKVNNDKEGYPLTLTIKAKDGSPLVNDKLSLAAEVFGKRGIEGIRQGKAKIRELVDAIRAEGAAPRADSKAQPEQPASKTPTVDAHAALMDSVRSGNATPEQFKAGFDAVVAGVDAIKAELGTKTKASLLEMGGPYMRMRYASENKPEIIDALYREMLGEYALGESVTYGMGKGAYEAAVRRMVEATTAEKLARYVDERKAALAEVQAARAAKAAAIENPQTLGDYREAINAKIREGMTRKEAFLTLTPEQRIQYDTLEAEASREKREASKRAMKTQVRAAGQPTGGEIVATKHTRDGYDLFVVQLAERLSAEDYKTVLASAKKLDGWYSAFRGNGAIPGFQFKDRANAEAFLKLAGGDTTDAQAQAEQRRDAFEDNRSETAVERLRAMADKLEAQASEVENASRKTNTERRARFASAALAGAAEDKAKAKTMRNIADGIADGRVKFLDEVRTKSQVDLLAGIVATAKSNELRAKYPSYADQEKRRGEPATAETADFAEFPSYGAFRSDLATLGRQLLEVEGTKKLGQRLMAVADDVSDAYLEFAKEPGNLFKLSTFSIKRGDEVKAAIFPSKDLAEKALKRSGLTGKAIVLAEKRGVNRIIMSPSEAINAGIWAGDGDKRITLSADFGAELVEAIGRRGNKANNLTVPWQFQNAYDRRKALSRMGIETPSEFRSALREFIDLKAQATTNRVKAMELEMVGRRADGLDFFPTAAEVADQMVEAADLSPDMAVLEPSAGMGHLADRIREAGAEPDVIEISPERRELLEEKGYHLADVDDFMALQPRTFFTYGDVFRAPDGTEGIMRGGNSSMGSDRVMLVDEGGKGVGAGFYNRSELTGIRHRGSDSGYDRIIMNPPFSNRRDAEHVRHAYGLLKPGGRIVAIMGEGVFFGQDKKAQEFREWLESVGGTSEKLPEGSFMDPSLPVNTAVNARMVVIDKPLQAEEATGESVNTDTRFSQSLLAPKGGTKPTLEQVQGLVNQVQAVAKNVIPVTVVGNPSEVPGLEVPVGSKPSGVLTGGRVYLFTDNIRSTGDAYATLFHELFHLGLQKVIPAEDYAALLKSFANNPLVQNYVRRWKNSTEGQQRAAAMPSAAYEALAIEEALAMVSEELSVDGTGTKRMPAMVKRMLSWLAEVADRMNFPASFGTWIRGLTQTDAERFVSDMTRAALGGEKNLAQTQAKYGTMARQMTQQTRLRDGAEEARLASIFDGLQGNAQDKMRAQRELRADPRAEAIREVEANFMDMLARLDDAKLVEINC